MNFLKHQLHKLRKSIDPAKAKTSDLQALAELQDDIKAVRDVLISCNQRLVYNNAKKHLGSGENIDDLVSDGNLSLMRAVEKFDYSRASSSARMRRGRSSRTSPAASRTRRRTSSAT
jgi:DNA-directed RNA polymerase sigma subunit (sigma70/sigma32)